MLEVKTMDYLKKQKELEYKFEDIDKLKLAYDLIENIGDVDPIVRDEIIYPNLAHLLYDKHFTEEQLSNITRELISDRFLHFDIDNDIELSVLVRSFTTLQLAILVHVHNRDQVLDEELMNEVYFRFLDYFNKEENLEGYREGVGFMHSIAHAADLFGQMVKVELYREDKIRSIFKAISKKFKTSEHFFMYDEDERMTNAIFNALERGIVGKEFMIGWIHDFSSYKKIDKYPEAYFLTNNIKILLRSIYFRALKEEKYSYLTKDIEEVLKDKVKLR